MHTFPGGILEEDLQIKMVREGFQKKPYKLGLLAQPPLTPPYLRNWAQFTGERIKRPQADIVNRL